MGSALLSRISNMKVLSGNITLAAASITNAMLAGSIAYSKLTLTGAIVGGDLAADLTLTTSGTITCGILNAVNDYQYNGSPGASGTPTVSAHGLVITAV